MRTTRRAIITGAVVAVPLISQAAQAAAKKADFLFVQTAKAMSFDKSTNQLTLEGVSPITVMFTDRPERIASQMKTQSLFRFGARARTVSFPTRPMPMSRYLTATN